MIKNYNTLNRALIKRVELLPNVFEFKTEKYGIHEYAAIYGIEKIVRRCKATKLLKSQPNYYLERQHKRLVEYAASGKVTEFNYLSEIILRKSNSYRVLSMNRTLPRWWENIRYLRKTWNVLKGISSSLSSDLKFKRVWIDKKPGDYARPLGVPTPAWRCYAFQWMHHIETFMKAAGHLQSWQHGGRSGVGVLSCYKQLIPRLKSSNTIYEFDIKGFFDNISHEKITERFEETMGPKVSSWISKILESKPSQYKLPPKESDIAVKKWEETEEFLLDYYPAGSSEPLTLSYIDLNESERESIISELGLTKEDLVDKTAETAIQEGEATPIYRNQAPNTPHKDDNPELSFKPITMDEIYDFLDPEDKAILNEFRNEKSLTGPIYKDLMNGSEINYESHSEIHLSPSESERGLGRDYWKNLGLPGKGVPQGLNTSPFISTFLTDYYLRRLGTEHKALIMYMDDGVLFADSKAQMGQYVRSLKESLKLLGLELAEEKCQYVKENGEWKNSLKFLGLRYIPESDQLMSDTRSGTKMLFPAIENWENIKAMAEVNNMSLSNTKEKYDRLINTQAYEAGLKYGFLGCLIANSQYKDGKTLEERQTDIRVGQGRSWARMVYAKQGFMWKTQDLYNHVEYIKADEVSLTNYSSVATHRFLDFLSKGRKLFIHKRGYRSRKQRV